MVWTGTGWSRGVDWLKDVCVYNISEWDFASVLSGFCSVGDAELVMRC